MLRDLGLAEPFVVRPDEKFALPLRKRGENTADGLRGEFLFAGAVFFAALGLPLELLAAAALLIADDVDRAMVNKREEPRCGAAAPRIETCGSPPEG